MTVRGANYDRRKNDDYPTPPEAVDVLFRHVTFNARILDPACGKLMRVVEAAKRAGYAAVGEDIVNGKNFVARIASHGYDIVTNPPFGVQGRGAMQFIEHALLITQNTRGRVAMLLPADFDSAKTRAHVFGEHPAFMLRLTLLDRIKWFNDQAGSLNHCWFVWCWQHRGPPTVKYARIENDDSEGRAREVREGRGSARQSA